MIATYILKMTPTKLCMIATYLLKITPTKLCMIATYILKITPTELCMIATHILKITPTKLYMIATYILKITPTKLCMIATYILKDHTHTSLHDFGLGLKETRFSSKALHFHASFGEIQTVATASNMFSLFFSPFLILMLCIISELA